MHGRITAVDAVGRDERRIGWCHLSCRGIVFSRLGHWRRKAVGDRGEMGMIVFLARIWIPIR